MTNMPRFEATNAVLNALYAPFPETQAMRSFQRAFEKVQMAKAILSDALKDMADNGAIDPEQEAHWEADQTAVFHDYFEDHLKAFEDKYRDINNLPERG